MSFCDDLLLIFEKEATYQALQKAKEYKVEHGKYPSFEQFLRWKRIFYEMYIEQLKIDIEKLKRKLEEADADEENKIRKIRG